MDDNIKSILEIIDKFETRINTYWNFFFIIILATIGWLMSSAHPFTINQGIALAIALIVFFIFNFIFIIRLTTRIIALESELKLLSKKSIIESPELRGNLSKNLIPFRRVLVCIFHLGFDLIALYSIKSKLF